MKKNILLIFILIISIASVSFLLACNQVAPHTYQRWRNDIGIEKNSTSLTGNGISIALIDTGVDINHTDLKNANITCIYVNNIDSKNKNDEHGTAMAGIIVGNPTSKDGILGIAPKAALLSIDFSNQNSDEVNKLIDAIYIAIENEADIINISMGIDEDSESLHKAITDAYEKGIIIISAAGNCENGEILYPAKYDEVISVGAMNKDNTLMFNEKAKNEIDVFAPGKNILTTYSSPESEEEYISADGSSPATAIVSGIVALVKEQKQDITTIQLLDYFEKNKVVNVSDIINYLK